jgi:hypothetical protein
MIRASLVPYPGSPSGPVLNVDVEMVHEGASLWLRFTAEGDVDRLAWPREAAPERTDDLWRHTCFEAFVRTGEGYREYNLSPSGAWASYAFDGYRSGMRPADEGAIVAPLDLAADQVALEARIDLPPGGGRLALSAVIEDLDGEKTYWALAHPSDKPDFHHPDSFVLDLP